MKRAIMTDNQILRQSYENPAVFATLFDRHSKRMLAIARRATLSKDEAEDIVQEVFVRIYKHGKKYVGLEGNKKNSKQDFRSWTNAIVKNCIVDYIRKRERSPKRLSEEMESALQADDEYSTKESSNYVSSIFEKLDHVSAEILNLRYVLGKSFKEIARILSITSGTARVRVYRAKKNFIQIHKANI